MGSVLKHISDPRQQTQEAEMDILQYNSSLGRKMNRRIDEGIVLWKRVLCVGYILV